MDISIILTYRCNSKCSMCSIWKYPTNPAYEIQPTDLSQLPSGFDYLNLTGGEPTLREDLLELCDVLYSKTRKLEISTNGLHGERLVPIVKKYPDIKIRVSLEGIDETNDLIRGEQNGFKKKIATIESLIEVGGCDLGFATTFQDENIEQILQILELARKYNVELATSALHNGFQFHKNDNTIYDRVKVAKRIEPFIENLLRSKRPKDWFRAYLNLGLIRKVLGQPRLQPCTQGTDSVFIDPWGDVYACNVRNDLYMGNIKEQTWDKIYSSETAREVREKVKNCQQNCWMVSSAKTAMRSRIHPQLPKISVLGWVLINKLKIELGLPITFKKYIDYNQVVIDKTITQRESFLMKAIKKELQPSKSMHYTQFQNFFNK